MSVQVAGNPGSPLGIKRAKLVVRRVLDIIANIGSLNFLTPKPGLLSLQALRPLHLLPSRTSVSCARRARDPGSPNVIRAVTTAVIKWRKDDLHPGQLPIATKREDVSQLLFCLQSRYTNRPIEFRRL
jgi:hypothetical protein